MTKAAIPFTFASAAKRTIDRIGMADAAQLVGKSVATLEAWRDHDNPRLPRIDQALSLDVTYAALGGDGSPFLDAMQAQIDFASDDRDACRSALAAGAAALAKEHGDLIAATFDVMHPDATQRDTDRAMVEAQQVVTRADAMVRLLKSFCRRGAGPRAQMTGGAK